MSGRVTKPGVYVIGAAVASAIAGIDTKQTVAFQIFTFLFFTLLFSAIFSLFFRCRFTCSRTLPRFGSAGDPLSYTVRVRNESAKIQKGLFLIENFEPYCPTIEEFIHVPEPGEESRNAFDRYMGVYRWRYLTERKQAPKIRERALPDIPANGECEIELEFIPPRRGHFHLESFTIARPDPLGLFNAFVRVRVPDSLLILPKRHPVPELHFPGKRKFQSGGVSMASSIGESDEFVSLRDYRPGDPLRKIHWKSWARTGKPVVKEFSDEFFVRHALVLDTFQDVEETATFEAAVSAASSFACSILTQESLLDLMFVGPEAYCFTSGRGLAHTDKTLEVLASVAPCLDKPFDVLTPLVMGRASLLSGCVCIFLAWDEKRKRFVDKLRSFRVPLLVLVITESGLEKPPDPGPMIDKPGNFCIIEAGKIGEGLAGLPSNPW